MKRNFPHPTTKRFFFDGLGRQLERPSDASEIIGTLSRFQSSAIGEMNTTDRTMPWLLQAEHTMRNGDVVRIGPNEGGLGQDISNYIANPTVTFDHCRSGVPIGRMEVVTQNLNAQPFANTTGVIKFHADPLNAPAQLYYVAARDRMISAGSTEIWCYQWEAIREEGQEGIPDFWLPWDIGESELCDFTLCCTPNDPLALRLNDAPQFASELLEKTLNAASLASKTEGLAHAKEVAKLLLKTYGREAFSDVEGMEYPRGAARILPAEEPEPAPAPAAIVPEKTFRKFSALDIDLIANAAIATI